MSGYTKKELLDELDRLQQKLGQSPALSDLREYGMCSYQPYKRVFGGWNSALKAAGYDPQQPQGNYSREELIEELHRLKDELGRIPIQPDLANHAKCSIGPYKRIFGSFDAARRKAGYDYSRKTSNSELIEALQDLKESLGTIPRTTDMRDQGAFSAAIYQRRFGSWESALDAAGYECPWRCTRSDLLQEIDRLKDELGRVPGQEDMKSVGEYSTTPYYAEFGGWTEALNTAGYEPTRRCSSIPKEELMNELKRLSTELDRSPRAKDMKEHGEFSATTYRQHFEDWNAALAEIGCEPNIVHPDPPTGNTLSKDTLIQELERLAEKVGSAPTRAQMDDQGKYHSETYVNHFGSWKTVLSQIGETPNYRNKIPDEELFTELHRLHDELGRLPKQKDMDSHGKYSRGPYLDRFGYWDGCLDAAGLNPKYSREALLNEIQRLAEKLNKTPTLGDLNEHSDYSLTPFRTEFGSWVAGIKAAGYTPREFLFTDSELIDEITRLKESLGHPPSIPEMKQHGKYSERPYIDRFGSWIEALQKAGYKLGTSRTDIERRGVWILEELDIDFQEFVPFGKYEVDVVIDSHSIVIEWDGDYWHGHPDIAPFTEKQKRAHRIDQEKNEFLESQGYTVVRVWGSDIRDNYAAVRETLEDILKGDAAYESGTRLFENTHSDCCKDDSIEPSQAQLTKFTPSTD